MGSVINYTKCDKCGREKFEDYYYKTGEEYCTCVVCGKSERHFMKREKGKIVLDENNNPIWIQDQNKGYGTAYIQSKEGIGNLHVFKKNITKKDIKEFVEIIKQEGINKEGCRLIKWDDEKKELVSLYGKIPEEFPEFDEEVIN